MPNQGFSKRTRGNQQRRCACGHRANDHSRGECTGCRFCGLKVGGPSCKNYQKCQCPSYIAKGTVDAIFK